MAVREIPISAARQPLRLIISQDPTIPSIDLQNDDVLFSAVEEDTQICDPSSGKPWRGPKQKSDALLKVFVSGLSPPNGIVVDLSAGVGKVLMSTTDNMISCFKAELCFN